jgi:nickel/cobalt exporter
MTMSRIFAPLAVLAAMLLLGASVLAQQPAPPKSPFGTAPPGAERSFLPPRQAAEPVQSAGPLQRAQAWVLEKQAQFNRELAAAVRNLKTASPLSATLMLAALSFAYGVLHAAGPGHGKAVISSYVLADGRTVRRGILLAFLAALIQALSALVVVTLLVLLLSATGMQIRAMEAWLETASWALVALVGVWLLYYQLRSAFRPAPAHAGHHHHHADHHHEHGAHAHSHEPHGHDRTHAHGHADACEVCAHLPAAAELQGDWSWRRALALAFAVGVRPCTGAILVLVFAIGQGLLWAGVLSTFAMALGTAITVSVLAASAVGFRELAARVVGGSATSKWADRVQLAAGLVGASLVLVLGASFCLASLSTTKQF